MKKIGVIVNPNAKKVRKGRVSIDDFLKMKSDFVDVRITKTLDEIDGVLQEFKRNGIDYIGITGGDGSLHHVITRMIRIYHPVPLPGILILKGGTMDNVAKSIGLRGKGGAILKRMIKTIKKGKEPAVFRRDTMEIEGRYCFLFGNGFTANFLNEVYKYEKGIVSNARVVFKAISHAFNEPAEGSLYKGIHGTVTVDGEVVGFNYITAILAGTVENISRGITPLKLANKKERTFHAIISGFSGKQILARIYFLLGITIRHPLMKSGLFTGLSIDTKEGFDYTMDGDMYHSPGALRVELGPEVHLVKV